MIIYYAICLLVTLLSLEVLIVSGFRSTNHRLLPLILGLIALYDFYLIVEYQLGQNPTMDMLKDLLLVQVINLVTYFIMDFMEIRLQALTNIAILTGVFVMDVVICLGYLTYPLFQTIFIIYVVISVLTTMAIMIDAIINRRYSRRTFLNNIIVFGMMFLPSVTLIPSMFNLRSHWVILPGVLMVICVILDFFFLTDRLRDVKSYLKEEIFSTMDVPAILFDYALSYIDSTKNAKELFPDIIEEMETVPDKYDQKKLLEEFIQSGGGVREQLYNNQYFLIRLQEVKKHNKIQGYILRFIDITKQQQEIESVREMMKQKSEFLANMSHDLRSPLHAILGGSELILSKNETSLYGQVMLGRIHDAGESLLEIVNSILDFSKIENGSLELHKANYNFRKLVEAQAQIGFVNLKNTPVKLSFEIQNPFPEILLGDEMRVRQILQNILSNATKYTESGSISCTISFDIIYGRLVKITYRVTDTGVGMSKEQLKTIFGDYVTYAGDIKREGTGLGLSIVKKLAYMMGGYTQAESTLGEGSTISAIFYQELPADLSADEIEYHDPIKITKLSQLDSSKKIWSSAVVPSYTYPDARILIVDDMEVNRSILRDFILPWNIKMDFAEDGLEATKMAKENKYDMIILDQMMPNMTGTEAADVILSFCDCPLVLLTADITEEMRRESVKHGFSSFLQKPIDSTELKNVIEKTLPENLRLPYGVSGFETTISADSSSKNYKKSISIFLKEMRQLYDLLPSYSKDNQELFRNKVHGIKGVSKQLGQKTLAMSSEIMEMAAKTENLAFIDSFFATFYSDLELTIAEVQAEYDSLIEDENEAENENILEDPSATDYKSVESNPAEADIIEQLCEALDSCDIETIEEAIELLKKLNNPSLSELADQVQQLSDECEYEAARELVQNVQA